MAVQDSAGPQKCTTPPIVAYIGLGSNLGDRQALLDEAVQALRSGDELKILRISPWYESEPVGGPKGQGDYLNGVAELVTTLSAMELLKRLLAIEEQLGRKRQERWGARCIDLDLLLYGQEVIQTGQLQVPHPLMHKREFVLRGLVQIAPQVRHPLLGVTAKELWQEIRKR